MFILGELRWIVNESLIIFYIKDLYDKFGGNKFKVLIFICYDSCWVKVSGEIWVYLDNLGSFFLREDFLKNRLKRKVILCIKENE